MQIGPVADNNMTKCRSSDSLCKSLRSLKQYSRLLKIHININYHSNNIT